jgi:hypothetical protein
VADPVACFPATLLFAEPDDAALRLDGLAGIPVPARFPAAAGGFGPINGRPAPPQAGGVAAPLHPFSMLVDAPGDAWLAVALITLERWTDRGAALAVEVARRAGRCQARMSDGTASALFDVRRADGLFWLTIGTP